MGSQLQRISYEQAAKAKATLAFLTSCGQLSIAVANVTIIQFMTLSRDDRCVSNSSLTFSKRLPSPRNTAEHYISDRAESHIDLWRT